MLALRELTRPIPDAALPNLEQHKRRGALAVTVLAGCSDCLGNTVDALNGTNNPARIVPNIVLNALVCGSIFLALRKPGHRSADPALFAIAGLVMLNLMTNGWVRYDGRHDLVPYAIMVPFAVAVFAPWRPTYSLILGFIGAAVTLVCHATKVMILPTDPVTHAVMCVIAGLCGAAGAQLQRRLWLSLEGARAQLAAAERMTSLGRMTAGVAHELKTPLACAMNATASLDALTSELEQSIGHPDVTPEDMRAIAKDFRDLLDLVRVSVNRSTQFIQAMRAHTVQLGSDETSVLDVAKVVQSSLTLLAHEVRRSGVTVDTSDVDPAVTCAGDGGKLGQIITNLVNNALDACAGRPGARVTVSAVVAVGVVRVTVADDGPGVPEALRERIFDLLFTTRATQGGTGVGLALSRDLAEGAFGGTLRLVPSERGACFVLEVPRERSPSATTAAPRAAAPWSPSETRGAERPALLADAVRSAPPLSPSR